MKQTDKKAARERPVVPFVHAPLCFAALLGVLQATIGLCPVGHKSCYNSDGNVLEGCCEGSVCCKDMLHCCPENFACNDTLKRCVSLNKKNEFPNLGNKVHSPEDVVCKDGITKCPDRSTCCLLPPGGYGCCGYPEATCCHDMTHCCPQGYECVEGSNACKRGNTFILGHNTNPRRLDNLRKLGLCGGNLTQCVNELPYINMKQVHITENIKLNEFLDARPIDLSKSQRSNCDSLTRACAQGCCPDKSGTCCLNKNYCCPQNFTCTSDGMCATLKKLN